MCVAFGDKKVGEILTGLTLHQLRERDTEPIAGLLFFSSTP